MEKSDVVICCLNKNTVLLHQNEFDKLGNHKILFNVGLSPAWDTAPFEEWLNEDNLFYCDSARALGNNSLMNHRNVRCMNVSSGITRQAYDRLSKKVINNLSEYCK